MQQKLLKLLIPLLLLLVILSFYSNYNSQASIAALSDIVTDFKSYQKDGKIVFEGIVKDIECSIIVNGKPIEPDQRGYFYDATVKSDDFDNKIIQVETVCGDIHKVARITTELTESDDESDYKLEDIRFHAIIIGINNYRYLDKLITPVNDAKEIAKVLKEQYGFKVTLLTDKDANRNNILNTIQKVSDQLQKDDALLIYYSGHGFSDVNTKSYYWHPVNSDPTMMSQWIPTTEITNRIASSKSSSILIISDSCYAGSWNQYKGTVVSKIQASYEAMLLKKHRTKSRILLASGGDEPVEDGNAGNSVFATSLLNILSQTEKNAFSASYLHSKIRSSVELKTVAHQTPVYQSIRAASHEGSGDFVFVRKGRFTRTNYKHLTNDSTHEFLAKIDKAVKAYKKQTEDFSHLPTDELAGQTIVPDAEIKSLRPMGFEDQSVEKMEKEVVASELIKSVPSPERNKGIEISKKLYYSSFTIRTKPSRGVYVLAMGANTHGLIQANADAKKFADAMKQKFRIPRKNIILLKNVSKRSFNKAINTLAKKHNKKHVYVYFSGHGTRIKANNKKTEGDCHDEALVFYGGYNYRDDYFINKLNSIKTKKLITVLDTSFSAGMAEAFCSGAKAKSKSRRIMLSCKSKIRTTAKRLRGLVYVASQENQLAWEIAGKKGGGRFTKELLHFLNKKNMSSRGAFSSAFRSARAKIIRETKGTACYQRPQLFR